MSRKQSDDGKVWISWGKVRFILGVRYYSMSFSIGLWAMLVYSFCKLLDLKPYATSMHGLWMILSMLTFGAVIFFAELGFTTALENYLRGKWTKNQYGEEVHIFCNNSKTEEEKGDV